MNERDSETIAGIFSSGKFSCDFQREEDPFLADFLVINTCSVRENADNKLKGLLGRLKYLDEKNEKRPRVLVCGCMMQVKETRDKIFKDFPFIDFVFGTQNIEELEKYLNEQDAFEKIKIIDNRERILEGLPVAREFKYRALVNITEGCDNFCSYCIVPYVRGREKSRTVFEIKKEISDALENGVKEIILLGQNVNSYKSEGITFPELLEEVLTLPIKRLRYMTANPKDVSDELIKLHAKHKNLMPSMHIPIQSGSSRILKAMNRKYTKEDYLNLVQKIRKENPNIAITTDIMIGFPGETEEDFLETLDVALKAKFNSAFTFIYSKRPLTKAASMQGSISKEELSSRFERLTKTIYEIMLEKNKAKVGQEFEVFIDKYTAAKKNKPETFSGKTEDGTLVNLAAAEGIHLGDVVRARIIEAKVFYLLGK